MTERKYSNKRKRRGRREERGGNIEEERVYQKNGVRKERKGREEKGQKGRSLSF